MLVFRFNKTITDLDNKRFIDLKDQDCIIYCMRIYKNRLLVKNNLHINRSKSLLLNKNLILGIFNFYYLRDSKEELFDTELIGTNSLGNTDNIVTFAYLVSE